MKSMDLFARQGAKRSNTEWYCEHLQRSMANKSIDFMSMFWWNGVLG
jgi:hypothetical protein